MAEFLGIAPAAPLDVPPAPAPAPAIFRKFNVSCVSLSSTSYNNSYILVFYLFSSSSCYISDFPLHFLFFLFLVHSFFLFFLLFYIPYTNNF